MGRDTPVPEGYQTMRCGNCGSTTVQLLAKQNPQHSQEFSEIVIACQGRNCKSRTLLRIPTVSILAIPEDGSPGTHCIY